jgi:hypothetical protein
MYDLTYLALPELNGLLALIIHADWLPAWVAR